MPINTKKRTRVGLYPESVVKDLVLKDYDFPNLIELQVDSFDRFVKEGIKEEFQHVSPIVAYGGKYELEFLDGYYLD